MKYNLEELRESLSPSDIKEILAKYGVEPHYENQLYIVFPTCCHNLDGGSFKLYYYFDTHIFRCYTECDSSFDIFELLIKMNALRGKEISLYEAISLVGFSEEDAKETKDEAEEDNLRAVEHLKVVSEASVRKPKKLQNLTNQVLSKYIFNERYLSPWVEEGISIDSMRRFNIKYDPINAAIVIPHKDVDGNLVGVRGRFMEENAENKYMPLTYCGKIMAHSLRDNLYGIWENKETIKRTKTVILFEGEKSVLKMDTAFGEKNNFSLATCGNKISNEQITLLRELNVSTVILAFDKDYKTDMQRDKIQDRYDAIARKLSMHFTTAVIFDYGDYLDYKDSPIDKGKETFEELYSYRYYI